jgi:hypothetical protein
MKLASTQPRQSREKERPMPARQARWLTAQQAAAEMNTTSAEICRLLSLGRLSGHKQKQPGRPGNGQWLIDPKSIAREKRCAARRTHSHPPSRRSRKPAEMQAPSS